MTEEELRQIEARVKNSLRHLTIGGIPSTWKCELYDDAVALLAEVQRLREQLLATETRRREVAQAAAVLVRKLPPNWRVLRREDWEGVDLASLDIRIRDLGDHLRVDAVSETLVLISPCQGRARSIPTKQ